MRAVNADQRTKSADGFDDLDDQLRRCAIFLGKLASGQFYPRDQPLGDCFFAFRHGSPLFGCPRRIGSNA